MNGALLLNERIIALQPALVRVVGIAEATILQQMHYWLARATCEHDGERWVYKTYADWSDETGMSEKAVRGALDRLRKIDVVIATQNPRDSRDRTRWWRIDYAALDAARTGAFPSAPEGRSPDLPPHADADAASGRSHAGVPNSTKSTAEEHPPYPPQAGGATTQPIGPRRPTTNRGRQQDAYRSELAAWTAVHFPDADANAVGAVIGDMPAAIPATPAAVRAHAESRGGVWTSMLEPRGPVAQVNALAGATR